MSKKKHKNPNVIASNKRARHDYFIENTFEAGLVLTGWEVKSLRAGKCQLTDSYVLLKNDEAWLLGTHIEPLKTVSTHLVADPTRTRKLLLHHNEIARLIGATQQKGYTAICTKIYWKKHLVKCEIALGKGKKDHDKRATIKDREWGIAKQRLVREHNK